MNVRQVFDEVTNCNERDNTLRFSSLLNGQHFYRMFCSSFVDLMKSGSASDSDAREALPIPKHMALSSYP